MQSRFHLLVQVETESLILGWVGFFRNLDDLSCADCSLGFKKLVWSFFLSITKVPILSLCVCSQFRMSLSLLSGAAASLPQQLLFPIQLSAYVYLLDSHLSLAPLTALYIMSELVFPQQELV